MARESDEIRFWKKVELATKDGSCWPWRASLSTSGYGLFRYEGRQQSAHRVAYRLFTGPIPDGLQLDHLCRNRTCCNPAHLEPVTQQENMRRGSLSLHYERCRALTHCRRGHPLSGVNLYIDKRGRRDCCECRRARKRAHWAKTRGALWR